MGVPIKKDQNPIIDLQLSDCYDSIDTLWLYNWDRYLATRDVNWFRKDFNGGQKKSESPILKEIEAKIREEYCVAMDDKKFEAKLQKWALVDDLQTKLHNAYATIFVMQQGFENNDEEQEMRYKYIVQLNLMMKNLRIRYVMPFLNAPIDDLLCLQECERLLEGVKTRIVLLNHELKDDAVVEQKGIYQHIRIVAIALGQNQPCNPRETVLSQWIADCKLMQEMSKQN